LRQPVLAIAFAAGADIIAVEARGEHGPAHVRAWQAHSSLRSWKRVGTKAPVWCPSGVAVTSGSLLIADINTSVFAVTFSQPACPKMQP
jgi:hypothetical protein